MIRDDGKMKEPNDYIRLQPEMLNEETMTEGGTPIIFYILIGAIILSTIATTLLILGL